MPHPTPCAPGVGVRRSTSARLLVCLALAASPRPGAAAGDTPAAPPEPWGGALRFDFNPAADAFARMHAAAPDDPRLALAHASALLARQPRTQANIHEARAVLEKIVASAAPATDSANSTGPAPTPDLAIGAKLLLGRIAESHLTPPRPDEARRRYESLLREHPGHPLADQAAVHLALLAAFPAQNETPLAPDAMHARLDALRQGVRTPEALREIHSIQGRLFLDAGNPRSALPHLVAARAIGHRQPDRDAMADLTIANLARDQGEPALAIAHYREFLRARPRDARATTASRLLAELEAASAPSGASSRP